ncbi:DNA repair protein complementing XP G cells [Echinococcus multilocularis]|uniref:DNA repair protein complementing XP G cells n=1 Tax=Echinococcus multilocularis TaxID=6211 RepID=A0A068XVD3_ECHMU|nr:DNA repair protein complementing XP G cells [Echinococcus multilocularis]
MNIWLHQALKANVKGGRNLHLAILFQRICKLLFFGIRPIFVFDGAVPALKKATMAARRISRSTAKEKSCQARDRLLKRLFRRLAESAAKSQTPSEELIAEFVRRFNSTEEIRKAELDVEMFGSQSSSIKAAPSTALLQLEEEQESASQLAWDFVDNSPSIDLQSDAFSALPIQAQLRVILILLNAQIQPSSQSLRAGESFSQTQVNRLIARRNLALKKVEIESKINEVLVASVTPRNLPSGLDMSVTAQRIASQDEGHAILMRKRSSKERADELKERLDRLLKGSVTEPVCDDEEDSKKALELANSPRDEFQIAEDHKVELVEKIMKTLEEHSSLESEVCRAAHNNAQLEGGDESTDFKDQVNRVIKLGGPSDQSNESTVDIEADDVKNEGELKLKKESDSEVSSTDLDEFTEVIDDTTTLKASSDLKHLASQSEGNEDFDHEGRITSEQSNIEVETAVIEITSEAPSSDSGEFADVSEPSTPVQPVKTLPKTQTFLEHEEEDDLAIDDDILRAEAEKLECQAQEATTSCVAEAQRLVQIFGFPLINSPEEAEAQCCYLQQLGLVDIVASDDSDVWVFGASLVCRHLFGRNKGKSGSGSSSLYCLKDIREQLGLDRRQFVRLALLCGSDYTDGLDNIGPIKALEILSTFATTSGPTFTSEEHEILLPLTEFRRRCQERGGGGRWTSTKFPADFPSEAVVKGYLSPRVENASEYAGFHWDTPNLLPLVKYPFQARPGSLEQLCY